MCPSSHLLAVGDTLKDTCSRSFSPMLNPTEAEALDALCEAPTPNWDNEDNCECQEPGCADCMQDATVAREADAPVAAFTHIWCDQEIHEHKARADGLEGRVAALESSLADSQLALKIMSEVGTSASSDAERYMDDARELSEMLTESTKRENRMHETLMGIRALAESNGLTDAEKVALILRLA